MANSCANINNFCPDAILANRVRRDVIIDEIRTTQTGAGPGVACKVHFENGARETHDIFAVTEQPHELTADSNGFLLGAFLPAWTARERRIKIEAPVCPLLSANLAIAASLFRGWFKDLPAVPAIEASREYRSAGTRVGVFFSGGVDSLAMVRSLTSLRPAGHPDRPTGAAVVDYQHVGGIERGETDARFARSKAVSQEICSQIGLKVIPIRSNFCQLNTSMAFWMYRYHGAFLASMAHFLSHEFRLFHITYTRSGDPIRTTMGIACPSGSALFESTSVDCTSRRRALEAGEGATARRLAPGAEPYVRVHVEQRPGRNCGRCEKCVRTKLQLLACGHLAEAEAFDEHDVRAADIQSIEIRTDYARVSYAEALPGLRAIGRTDLADAVGLAIRAYDEHTPERAGYYHSARRLFTRAVRKLKRSMHTATGE